jgi:hypothetical protein
MRMYRAFRRLFLILCVACLSLDQGSVTAGPIDLFRRVRDSIAHAGHHHTTPTKRENSTPQNKQAPTARNDFRPPPLVEAEESPSAAHAASTVPPAQRSRTDSPYAIPVPNKPGFVTSPYSPKSGYVDIRGFPSGTKVKDPYTGKVFITP